MLFLYIATFFVIVAAGFGAFHISAAILFAVAGVYLSLTVIRDIRTGRTRFPTLFFHIFADFMLLGGEYEVLIEKNPGAFSFYVLIEFLVSMMFLYGSFYSFVYFS